MADVNREALIKLGFDSGEVDRGLNLLKGSFTEISSVLNIAQQGFGFITSAYQTLQSTIARGQAFHELNTAFQNLYGSANQLGRDGLDTLRTAIQGTVTDVNLLKEANLAAQAGLSPDAFLKVAESAEKFGDIIGKGPTEALSELNQALVTGNERMLKRAGIDVDTAKAEKAYADSLGVSVKALDETAKKEAFRAEALRLLEEKVKAAGEANRTAGDATEQLNVKLENLNTEFSTLINNSSLITSFIDNLSAGLDRLGKIIEGDTQALGALVGLAADLATNPLGRLVFGPSVGAIGIEGLFVQNPAADSHVQIFRDRERLLAELNRSADEMQRRSNERSRLEGLASGDSADKMLKGALEAQRIEYQQFADYVGNYIETTASEGLFSGLAIAFEHPTLAHAVEKFNKDILQEQWKESADFFSDALYNAMTGAAFDAKDIMMRILAGVAGGFLAQLTGGMGAGFGSLQGIGQSIGQGLAGGGFGALGSFFGGGANIGPVADGASYGAMVGGGGFSLASLAGYAPLAAAAGTGILGAQAFQNVQSGNRLSNLQQFGLALPTFGASLAVNPIMGAFGGGISADRRERDELLNRLLGGYLPTVPGIRGNMQLHGGRNVVDTSNKLAGEAVGMANPLAQILSGGEDELGSGLAGVFASASLEGENLNEVLINMQSLFDAFNIEIPDAKDQLTALFLDGKISIEEFNASLASLNVIAQDNLIGQGSVADALKIVGDSAATPRARIKGLELAFKEMGEIGVDTVSETSAYLMDKFGPEAVRVFDKLREAGIDTWEEVANATSDQVNFMANLLNGLGDSLASQFGAGVGAANEFTGAVNDAVRAVIELRRVNPFGQTLGGNKTFGAPTPPTNFNSGSNDQSGS